MPIQNIDQFGDFQKLLARLSDTNDVITLSDIDLSRIYPTIALKLTGDDNRLNGLLTSSICKGLADFHYDLLKSYCIAKYNSDNLQKLNNTEKKQLEIVFKVEPGCTNIIADITELLNSLKGVIDKATDNMTGNQKTAFFIMCVLGVSGAYTFNQYTDLQKAELAANKEMKLAELNKSQITTITDTLENIVKDNNLTLEKYAKINAQSEKGYQNLIKAALTSGATKVEYMGSSTAVLEQADLEEISSPTQPQLKTENESYELEISSVKRNGLNLSVTANRENQDNFNLSIDTSYIEAAEIDLLLQALKNKSKILVNGSFKVRDGRIEKAIASKISVI